MKRWFVRRSTKLHVLTYRLLGGRFGQSMGGIVILVTTTGRKSKTRRTTPLMKIDHGDGYLLAASFGGADIPPAWYLNMKADENVGVQDGPRVRRMTAREASTDERDELYAKFVEMDERFARYQGKTARKIPVMILEPQS